MAGLSAKNEERSIEENRWKPDANEKANFPEHVELNIVMRKINHLIFLSKLSFKESRLVKKWDNDVEVSKYREVDRNIRLSSVNFGIYDKASAKLIGSIGISSIDQNNRHAEIGMAIGNKDYWGKGYGTDAVGMILEYCFNKLQLNKVYLDVWEENKRAIGCYVKCGFKKDGVLRQHVRKNGKYHNKWVMSILQSEWK